METQNFFYYVPKERIANLLNLPSSYDPKFIACKYKVSYGEAFIVLYDYVVPQHAIRTPDMQAYIGQMGTRAEIRAERVLSEARDHLNKVAKQFEI